MFAFLMLIIPLFCNNDTFCGCTVVNRNVINEVKNENFFHEYKKNEGFQKMKLKDLVAPWWCPPPANLILMLFLNLKALINTTIK